MFCKYCGEKISDDSIFCYKCGKETGSREIEVNKSIESNNVSRTNGEETIDYWYKTFSIKSASYDISDQTMLAANKMKKINDLWYFVPFAIVGFIVSSFLYDFFTIIGIADIGVLITTLVIGIVPTLFIHVTRENKLDIYRNIVIEENDKLLKYYASFEYVPFGFEYSNPRIIDRMRKIIKDGRAYSIKEALNCMIEDNHKEQLLINQNRIAASADTAALFAIGTFINTRKR